MPRHCRRRPADPVALERRDRYRGDGVQPDLVGERAVIGDDAREDILGVADKVHLVDRQRDMADADERHEVAVPTRLRQHTGARIDEDDCRVSGRGTRHHVARILLVAGRVGDDELAALRREIAVGDVDGDPLLALGRQPVDQQGKIDRAALRAEPFRIRLESRELILENHLRFEEQAADQRALAIVDAAASNEAQEALLLETLEILLESRRLGVQKRRHQK